MKTTKQGRPRRYGYEPVTGVADSEIALQLAFTDELRERVADQIRDLPTDILNHAFAGHTLTIGRLALHMAWAEYSWMERLGSAAAAAAATPIAPIRKELREALLAGSLERFGEAPRPVESAAWLIEIYCATREEITIPICRGVSSADIPVPHPALNTVRKVLQHLQWHWTYHSGHIGLLTLELGCDYTWRFEGL